MGPLCWWMYSRARAPHHPILDPMRAFSTGILAALLLSSCTMRKSAVWLDESSTGQRPVIGVARERNGTEPVFHLDYVAVRSCYSSDEPQRTFWQARGEVADRSQIPTRIAYGVAPTGMANEAAPQELGPGCYEALISGNGVSGSVRFVIAADGRVSEQRRPTAQ